jgi:hypothetical protein
MIRQLFLVPIGFALMACGARVVAPELPVLVSDGAPDITHSSAPDLHDSVDGAPALGVSIQDVRRTTPISNEKEEGFLGEGVELRGGHYVETWTLQVDEPGIYQFSLFSEDFDTAMRVRLASGREIYNDDAGDGSTNSRVRIQVAESQEVAVEITSYAAREQGHWQLLTEHPVPGQGGQILSAEDIELRMAGGDTAAQVYWMEMQAGESMQLHLTSSEFDTTLEVVSPEGLVWFNDDANDPGAERTGQATDSMLDFVAPVAGWYEMTIRAYGGGPLGAWELMRRVMPPVRLAEGREIPAEGYAGTQGRGRIRGLFIGITDYPDGPLFGCADDAEYLMRSLDARGLIDPADAIVLTNKGATRPAVEAAMSRLARESGPDDLVIIFYSGHGGIQTDDTPDGDVELDGTDETLVLIDEQMTDDDFAELLDPIGANTTLVGIDACQSGGFARDIMTRPGRVGLFSSDEDVLSDTADSLGAGGYLSWALREAVLRAADTRPADGMMTAGELTDSLVDAFAEHHRTMNPAGDMSPMQRLVIDRGSLSWSDRLWVYPLNADGTVIEASGVCFWSGDASTTEDVSTETSEEGQSSGLVGGGYCR